MTTTVELFSQIKHETDRAYLVDFGLKEPVWVPKSQVDGFEPATGKDDGTGTITIPEWLAKKVGAI